MSTQKVESSPKLYKRGNEDIDFDTFSDQATAELRAQLSNSRLKSKEKKAVQKAFNELLQGMSEGQVSYRVQGGGYNNTIGITNAPKGFDAAGIAAGILGNVLRRQQSYVDPSKIKWEGNTSIGKALVKRIWGGSQPSIQDFIGLDYDEATKKVSGNAKRSAKFKSELEYIRDNFDNLFTKYSDSDRQTAIDNINAALNAFSDNSAAGSSLVDNEYLDLSRATGLSNFGDLFGNTYETPSVEQEVSVPQETKDSLPEEPAVESPSVVLNKPLLLVDNNMYGKWSRDALYNHLRKKSPETLLKIINWGLNNTKLNFYLNPEIKNYAGVGKKPVPFSNRYIIKQILEILRQNGSLQKYVDGTGNQFYIPGSYLKNRNSGLVYDITGGGSIKELDVQNIPYLSKVLAAQAAAVPANKQGGLLRKLNTGDRALPKANILLGDDYDWYSQIFSGFKQEIINSFKKIEEDNTLTPKQKLAEKQKLVDQINDMQARHYTLMGNWDRVSSIRPGDESVKKYQQDIADNYNYVNTAIGNNISRFRILNNKRLNLDAVGKWNPDNRGEGFTKARTLLGEITQLKEDDEFWKELAKYGVGHNTRENYGNYNFLTLNSQKDTPIQIDLDDKKKDFPYEVDESDIPDPKTINFNGLKETLPDLIGASRLLASIRANAKVYRTMLPSLSPVLRNTYERFSPITGDYQALQLKGSQAANVMRQASAPFTSDASLASARMLEGQRQANQLQAEGALMDDKEIRRTTAEALARQEDNMARRSETANVNMAAINKSNREQAQLRATRLKSDWQSLDNYLASIEKRIRGKQEEAQTRANNFYDKIETEQALRYIQEYKNQAYNSYIEWTNEDPANKNKDITEWAGYTDYKRGLEEAQKRAQDMMYQNMANRYGWEYTPLYSIESSKLFFDRGWAGRYIK